MNSLNRDWEENRIQDVEVRYNSFVKPMFKIKDKLESDFIDEQTLSFVKMEIKNATYYAEKRERKRCLEALPEIEEFANCEDDANFNYGWNSYRNQAISAISNKDKI